MKAIKYVLAVNQPDSFELWEAFESATPFMKVSVGDFINPNSWPGSKAPIQVLKVTHIMHDVYELDDVITNSTTIFGTEVHRLTEFDAIVNAQS